MMEWQNVPGAAVRVLKKIVLLYLMLIIGFGIVGMSDANLGWPYVVSLASHLGLWTVAIFPVGVILEYVADSSQRKWGIGRRRRTAEKQ